MVIDDTSEEARHVPVPRELLVRLLDAFWWGQWETRNAAENVVCAHGCEDDGFKDFTAHAAACPFVVAWDELAELRAAVGDNRVPAVVGKPPPNPAS